MLNLAFQYFLIYALLWIFITVEDFTSFKLVEAKDAIESAKSTVQFAPMLAVRCVWGRAASASDRRSLRLRSCSSRRACARCARRALQSSARLGTLVLRREGFA